MLPGDIYVRQMLVQHHRVALSTDPPVPAWERLDAALRRNGEQRRGGRVWLRMFRLRPAHGGA